MNAAEADAGASPGAANAGSELTELGAECQRAGVAREVLLVRLSLIPERYFLPHYTRLAESALERLGRADHAHLYRLPGHDLALAWRSVPDEPAVHGIDLEEASTAALRMLFSAASTPLPPLDELLLRFHLPQDAAQLAALLRRPRPTRARELARPALDLDQLALLERTLAAADVSRFARRRCVARRGKDGFSLVFERRFLALGEVAASLASNRDLEADPWLFRRLKRSLDRRLLALLTSPRELQHATPLVVPLALPTILAPAFLAFDAALPAGLRCSIGVEVDAADVFPDPAAFAFARDFLHARGYRLLLAAPAPPLLAALPLDALGLDLLALTFSPALAELPSAALKKVLPPPEKIVLGAGCDDTRIEHPLMRAWGEALGITLFEVPWSALT